MNALESRYLTIGPTSGDHLHFGVVEVVPDGLQGAGDFSVSVSVSCDGFSASECSCWIQGSGFDEFLVALRSFEASRFGRVTLESMSPGEFAFTIASDSPTQWPTISGVVTGTFHSRAHRYRAQLTFAFTLDSSFVVQLLHDFESLLANDRNA